MKNAVYLQDKPAEDTVWCLCRQSEWTRQRMLRYNAKHLGILGFAWNDLSKYNYILVALEHIRFQRRTPLYRAIVRAEELKSLGVSIIKTNLQARDVLDYLRFEDRPKRKEFTTKDLLAAWGLATP